MSQNLTERFDTSVTYVSFFVVYVDYEGIQDM